MAEAASHLEALRTDVRDELKRRIEQRDKFSIQLATSLAAILAVAFTNEKLTGVLIAAPLVSIYFTMLILYSYRIHDVIAGYLREKLEPALASAFGTPVDLEWERYYATNRVPGIRRNFFVASNWFVSIASMAYLLSIETSRESLGVLVVFAVIYFVGCILVTAVPRFK